MKNHKKLFLILAVVAVLLISALSFVAPYYRCYRDFRQKTNYHFASVQDFLYQTQQKDQFSVQFIDQNVLEFTVGQHTVRAMSFESKGDIKYMLAIQEKGRWGDYYRFLALEFDAMEVLGTYNADTGTCAEPYASYTAMFLNDGCLIQVLSETPYVDTLGGPAFNYETNRIYNDDGKDYRYFQLLGGRRSADRLRNLLGRFERQHPLSRNYGFSEDVEGPTGSIKLGRGATC